jgi:molecular chaperone GrpE
MAADGESTGTEVSPDPDAGSGETESEAQAADLVADELGELGAVARERDDLRELAQRVQADFENYRKRVQREQAQLVERAAERLLEELLPVLDSFELAGREIEADTADVDKLRGGVLAAIRQLEDVLVKAGLEPVREVGVEFDPTVHEAVIHDGGDGDAVVGDVLRTGYRLKGRVLRPAMVRVTQGETP